MPTECKICVIGGGIGAFHVLEGLEKAAKRGIKIIAVYPSEFIEFGLAAGPILANPQKYHPQYTFTQWKRFKQIEYICCAAAKVSTEKQIVTLKNGSQISYEVLILANGSKLPLLAPTPGMSISDRQMELLKTNMAIKQAEVVVLYGAGLIGVEIAGDLRVKCLKPSQKIYLISKDGGVLKNSFPDDVIPKKVERRLKKMNITLLQGEIETVNGVAPTEPSLVHGAIKFKGDIPELVYDVYIPCFQQGGFTEMLPREILDGNKITVNRHMQSSANERVFVVGGPSSHKMAGHPIAVRTVAVAKTVAYNATQYVNGATLREHFDKESPPPGQVPGFTKVGHGEGGYLYWTDPGPLNNCCCLKCRAGFPCCPPPICWCWCHPCACGYCCGPNQSRGGAILFEKSILPRFVEPHGFGKPGVGLPPFPEKMLEPNRE